MAIEAVDLFYLRMPDVRNVADGTQDAFLVRLRDGDGNEGWGESDSSPLVCMATYLAPMSHSNIVGLKESLLGEAVETPDDIRRIGRQVRSRAFDIQHFDHAYSAADIALWDLLGRKRDEPVYRLLDGPGARSHPKRPYGSSLFGDTPEQSRVLAAGMRARGFAAAKFGWGPFGRGDRSADLGLAAAAREGLGPDCELMIDAGTAWGTDDQTALERARDLAEFNCSWLEEPLDGDAIEAYARLTSGRPPTRIAAGEASARLREAEDVLVNGGVAVLQIDAGRIGGITAAHAARRLAERHGASYVNHTFKSHVSLAAALHTFAAVEDFDLAEYAVGGSDLAERLTVERIVPDRDGLVFAPEAPGLGVTVDLETLEKYLVPVSITVGDAVVHATA
jgi:L-alanine-DL-glutamate epimerase-like enolase superfamily enzyme